MEIIKNAFRNPGSVTEEEVVAVFQALQQPIDQAKAKEIVSYCHSELIHPPLTQIATEVSPPTPGYSGVYRNLRSTKALWQTVDDCGVSPYLRGCRTVSAMWAAAAKQYADEPLLFIPDPQAEGHQYQTVTYSEVWSRSVAFGRGIRALCPSLPVADATVAVHLKTSPEWTVVQLGSGLSRLVPATMYDTLGVDGLRHILTLTDARVLVTSSTAIDSVMSNIVPYAPRVELVVVVNTGPAAPAPTPAPSTAAAAIPTPTLRSTPPKVVSFDDVVALGEPAAAPRPDHTHPLVADIPPSALYLICFTSGTTGTPKGVPISQAAMSVALAGGLTSIIQCIAPNVPHSGAPAAHVCAADGTPPDTATAVRHLAFLPMAHIMEQYVHVLVVVHRAQVAFLKGSTLTLGDDVAAFGPTILITAPRVLNRYHARLTAAVDALRASAPQRAAVFEAAYATKTHVLATQGRYRSPWDFAAFSSARAAFGGRLSAIISGSAPISLEVQQYLRIVLGVPVFEGYGMTEVLVPASNAAGAFASMSGSIGCPWPLMEWRTRDIPETGYFGERGRAPDGYTRADPRPGGEFQMRGPTVLGGYYTGSGQPLDTAGVVDADGWFSSGDVVVIGDGGEVRIVDRAKAMFKLSQGEYISPEKVEAVVQRVPPLVGAYVHAEGTYDFPVCALVVDPAVPRAEWPTAEDILPKVRAACVAAGLAGYEIPGAVVFSEATFDQLGLVTPTMKLMRHAAKAKFGGEMATVYAAAVKARSAKA